ncbi:MAG TPA: non-homologous end-joining DNA ligase [Mycobacteriales bacterium]|nr:non-homologous end-joining DNA ligase [Mycobacteriales bacterium]
MLATAGTLPTGPGWAYEFKWDGVRTLAETNASGFSLTSRLGNDVTTAYPELAGLAGVAEDVVLDGEVVSFVDGRPSFFALQGRMHVRKSVEARRLAAQAPVTYLVFDVLRLYGVDLTDRPFSERRATLERLEVAGPHWTVSPLFDDGPATAQAATENGLEGVVAKRLASTYRPGQRTSEWVKVRFSHRQEFVVGGWEHGEGGRSGGIGSLLLGVYEGTDLVYAGQVGTGFSGAALRSMEKRLRPSVVDTSPFRSMPPDVRGRPITWVRPEVVVEVEFAEWTLDGRLRFASFQGIRTDKRPEDVVREPDPGRRGAEGTAP